MTFTKTALCKTIEFLDSTETPCIVNGESYLNRADYVMQIFDPVESPGDVHSVVEALGGRSCRGDFASDCGLRVLRRRCLCDRVLHLTKGGDQAPP